MKGIVSIDYMDQCTMPCGQGQAVAERLQLTVGKGLRQAVSRQLLLSQGGVDCNIFFTMCSAVSLLSRATSLWQQWGEIHVHTSGLGAVCSHGNSYMIICVTAGRFGSSFQFSSEHSPALAGPLLHLINTASSAAV
jgi:hypothetical protein